MSESSTTTAIQELLIRFAAGDAAAKNALVERAYARLVVLARGQLRRFPKIRAEEETVAVFNESYKQLTKALDDVRPTTVRAFFGLAALQMRRVLLDLVRHGNRGGEPRPVVTGGLGGPAESGDGGAIDVGKPDPGVSKAGAREDILTALEKLPDDEREVVDLIFFNELTQAEAAEVLGVHEDTVKRRWARARVKLATLLADYAPPK